ncbi:hypothetical protein M8C17_06790 [Micromonospora sp. RHAY321]|uniref:hypothetical protein n=1 Tax=Micromonospora sp. RHAY321 TaxID=2944807 RepID=UPI00207C8696|nr:hypothetical protein [Micromonospora sp. RHAY321]MCO1594871.1 hypothetical protein [Micromonospora sp. RHAY321]
MSDVNVPSDDPQAPAVESDGTPEQTEAPESEPAPASPVSQQFQVRSSGDEPEEEIAPDSLRVDQRVGEELYGAQFAGTSYSHVSAHGATAFGNNNTIHHVSYEGQPSAKPIIRKLAGVPDLVEVYGAAEADDRLDEVLGHRPTACLTGAPNTGRFSTACAALARRHGQDRVDEVLLPAGVNPEVLHRDPDCIAENHGYVLRLPGNGHVQALRQLSEAFRRRSASLLLIRDADPRDAVRHSAEVPHRAPAPRMVFRRHVANRLRKSRKLNRADSQQHADRYLQHDPLCAALDATYGPREVVAIADSVASHHPADEAVLSEILKISQPRRRQRAAEILHSKPTEGGRRPRRADQHERAFRLAYAVCCWQPLHYVFESAGLLLEQIDGEAKRPDWGRLALQHPVSELLGKLDVDWQKGQERNRARGGVSRSAWLHDGGMRGAIIDVAWHEFDSTRPALLKWLAALVSQNDEPVRRAAAEAAGLLAHHDFDRVCQDLIDDWAAAPRQRTRQAAAWALVTADLGGQVDHLVREKVREWAHGRLNYQRDTAARIYASGLQQPDLSWSLADLRRIAEDRMQQDMYAVAEAINQLYTPDRADRILGELARWTEDRQLQRHAANALLALAWKTSGETTTGVPELMRRLAANDIDSNSLARVWRVALLAPDMSWRGSRALGQWLHHADLDESLRKSTGELLSDLASSPAVHRRMRFHLTRLPDFRAGLPEWIESAMRGR